MASRRSGRQLGPLDGGTPEAEELAQWLRKLTDGLTVRELAERFEYGRTQWTEFRQGRKLIPSWLVDRLVNELVSGLQVRQLQRDRGNELLAAAEKAAGSRQTAPVIRAGAGAVELELRLDEARKGQLQAQATLLGTNQLVHMLLDMVGSLQQRCKVLLDERDHARATLALDDQPAIQRELSETQQRLRETTSRLERARRERDEAEELRIAAQQIAEERRQALEQLRRQRDAQQPADTHGPGEPGEGADGEREGAAPHGMPQLWEYDQALESADRQMDAHDAQMTALREQMGIDHPQAEAPPDSRVVIGEVLASEDTTPPLHEDGDALTSDDVVRDAAADNADNSDPAPLSREEQPRSDRAEPPRPGLSVERKTDGEAGATDGPYSAQDFVTDLRNFIYVAQIPPGTLSGLAQPAYDFSRPLREQTFPNQAFVEAVLRQGHATKDDLALWEDHRLTAQRHAEHQPLLAEQISSPSYTNRKTRTFLADLTALVRRGSVSYETAADLAAASDPAELDKLIAGGFPSLTYTEALVTAVHGDVALWRGSWLKAANSLVVELNNAPKAPRALHALTRELAQAKDHKQAPRTPLATRRTLPSPPRGRGRARNWVTFLSTCLMPLFSALIGLAYTAGLRATPGPSALVLVVYAVLGLLALLAVSLLLFVPFAMNDGAIFKGTDGAELWAAFILIGSAVALVGGLVAPWFFADPVGRWLADETGLL
ncbi:hypothetical protein OG810_35575 [Streptomyces sp. NBC_01693]|nr:MULTISPECIES: hypothetical protein [unclassified Streptomyces]